MKKFFLQILQAPNPELYSKNSQTEITLNNSNMWDHQQWDSEHVCILSMESMFLGLEHISVCSA